MADEGRAEKSFVRNFLRFELETDQSDPKLRLGPHLRCKAELGEGQEPPHQRFIWRTFSKIWQVQI